MFQTLPGIILHFYIREISAFAAAKGSFQTLPGIILHFYQPLTVQMSM